MFDNELKLKGRLDSASNVEPDDVLPAKNKLKDLGFYEEPDYGMTPYPDDRLFEGIKKAQQQGGLTVDGIMKPGGETESYVNKIWNEKYGQGKLNRDFGIASPQASPSPQASSSVSVSGGTSLSHNGFTQDYDLRRKNLLNEDVKKAFAEHDRTNRQLQNPKTEYADNGSNCTLREVKEKFDELKYMSEIKPEISTGNKYLDKAIAKGAAKAASYFVKSPKGKIIVKIAEKAYPYVEKTSANLARIQTAYDEACRKR